MESTLLFDKELIFQLNIPENCDLPVSLPYVKKNIILRPLSSDDFNKGFLDVLKQLTVVGDISEQDFQNRFSNMKNCPDTYYILVIEDLENNCIIGTGSLIIEQKFIHLCSARGRIEDIVVNSEYRGNNFGKILITVLSSMAEKLNCYKVTLECDNKMLPFYESLNFTKVSNSNYLERRFVYENA